MHKEWYWGWFNGGIDLSVFFDLQDWGLALAAAGGGDGLDLRVQLGPLEVHLDLNWEGRIDDGDWFDEVDEDEVE